MEIESIDCVKDHHNRDTDRYEILLVDDEVNPVMKIILDKSQLWKISDYCREHLSYGAQLRKNKR